MGYELPAEGQNRGSSVFFLSGFRVAPLLPALHCRQASACELCPALAARPLWPLSPR